MKTIKIFLFLSLAFFMVSCDKDDDTIELVEFSITGMTPTQGTVGTTVTISGDDFPTAFADVTLSFNGVEATITSLTSTEIVTTVPAGATTGSVEIVGNGTSKSPSSDFTVLSDVVAATINDLHAPTTGGFGGSTTGPFVKFDFETGSVTTSETDWDIAFRATQIIVNGGVSLGTDSEPARNGNAAAVILDGLFSDVTAAPAASNFAQDGASGWAITASSDQGWYNYNFMTNVVSPLPGKVLVFRTRDGKYAKVEILSYYQGNPSQPNGFTDVARYYTFNYVYQPNDGVTSF